MFPDRSLPYDFVQGYLWGKYGNISGTPGYTCRYNLWVLEYSIKFATID